MTLTWSGQRMFATSGSLVLRGVAKKAAAPPRRTANRDTTRPRCPITVCCRPTLAWSPANLKCVQHKHEATISNVSRCYHKSASLARDKSMLEWSQRTCVFIYRIRMGGAYGRYVRILTWKCSGAAAVISQAQAATQGGHQRQLSAGRTFLHVHV